MSAGNLCGGYREQPCPEAGCNGNPLYIVANSKNRRLFGPQGVEIDKNGNCFVADTFCNCILKFDPNGRELGKYGCQGRSPANSTSLRT